MDWASTISAVAASTGLVFSGWQVLLLRKDRQEERRLGIDGVSVSWRPVVRPNRSDVDDEGCALWGYVLRVDNPGQFPISMVEVVVDFQVPFERIEHGGVVGAARKTMKLHQPVVPGGGYREWNRTLRVRESDRDGLQGITASVRFRDVDGVARNNLWPRS